MAPFGDINKYPARVRQENHFSWGHKLISTNLPRMMVMVVWTHERFLWVTKRSRFRSCDREYLLPNKSISLTQRPWRKNLPRKCTRVLPSFMYKAASIWDRYVRCSNWLPAIWSALIRKRARHWMFSFDDRLQAWWWAREVGRHRHWGLLGNPDSESYATF